MRFHEKNYAAFPLFLGAAIKSNHFFCRVPGKSETSLRRPCTMRRSSESPDFARIPRAGWKAFGPPPQSVLVQCELTRSPDFKSFNVCFSSPRQYFNCPGRVSYENSGRLALLGACFPNFGCLTGFPSKTTSRILWSQCITEDDFLSR